MSGISLPGLLIWYVVYLFSTTCHEFAHALVARWGGDSTAYDGGQVSLDPFPHIRREPVGMVLMPIVSFFLYGGNWMLGWASAPYDPRWASRHPGKYALMSAAGPFANFSLACIAALAMRFLVSAGVFVPSPEMGYSSIVVAATQSAQAGPMGALAMALSILLCVNVILGVFNLIPLPPLDGSGILEGLFPDAVGGLYLTLRSSPGFAIFAMLIASRVSFYLWVPLLGFLVSAVFF